MFKVAMTFCRGEGFSVWFVPGDGGMWKLLGVFDTGEEAVTFKAEVEPNFDGYGPG